ncbi:hypothetical protein Ancab_028549 [Ancistrocladus abbreviatus]
MYCSLSKSQALPVALRVSSQPKCLKPCKHFNLKSLSSGVYVKPLQNPSSSASTSGFASKTYKSRQLLKPVKDSLSFYEKTLKNSMMVVHGNIFCEHCIRVASQSSQLRNIRSFSNSYSPNAARGGGAVSLRRALPWLDDDMAMEGKRSEKVLDAKGSRASREESVRKFIGKHETSKEAHPKEPKRLDDDLIKESKRFQKASDAKARRSSWEESARKFIQRSATSLVRDERSENRTIDASRSREKSYVEKDDDVVEEGDEIEVDGNAKWHKSKNSGGAVDFKFGSEKPQSQRWSREEHWGRKTYREAMESSVPKMVGEGVYGVGPVLAALSAGRREFYVLYVQEGLDLSGNNRKKKDKKGLEKVLRIADKIGLSIKEASKHDLNMIVDNRPHQGLVLDASPLEMVQIKELDHVSAEAEEGLLWVALDEVTDPQNLGAIVRSSYFFGASGVVLCAKNSAPLSGVVSKASAGSLELMEVRSCKNMMQFLQSSANNGWRVIGGSISSRAIPLHEISPGAPTILVLGSEGTGLRPLVERSCTQLVRIPGNTPVDITAGRLDDNKDADMDHKCSGEEFRSFMAVESLNVSVAAGVLLHHLIGSNCKDNHHFGDE